MTTRLINMISHNAHKYASQQKRHKREKYLYFSTLNKFDKSVITEITRDYLIHLLSNFLTFTDCILDITYSLSSLLVGCSASLAQFSLLNSDLVLSNFTLWKASLSIYKWELISYLSSMMLHIMC